MRRREVGPTERDCNNVPLGEIHTIIRGPASGGAYVSSRNAYTKRVRYNNIFNVRRPLKQASNPKDSSIQRQAKGQVLSLTV